MPILVSTKGLGKLGKLLATVGLGNVVREAPKLVSATHDRFNRLQQQAQREDEELLAFAASFVKCVRCR